jgi:muramoyltetrapeptide carboxypeptidase LdcA involved in peptidoglycan recycling
MTFGHNEPMCLMPYGALAQVDCEGRTFTILEPGVV